MIATLFHPFEVGALRPPSEGDVLFLGAEPGFRLPEGWKAAIHAVQGFRPAFRALQSAGFEVAPRSWGEGFEAALVLAGRHRGRNELRVAEALERVRPDGLVVVAGGKTDGMASLRKRIGALLPLAGHAAKHHGLVFWLRRPADADAAAALRRANARMLVEGRFHTAPGMFSADAVDPGSRLLAQHLPADLGPEIADFGAGWGYLAAEAIARCPRLSRVDLYEADFESLEAAKRNLASAPEGMKSDFFWSDLPSEPVGRRYDAVVMNPPFHTGRSADPALGQGMIRAAARALKPDGRLILVANRQLPYERTLRETFTACGEVARDGRFKVLEAKR